VQRSGTLLITLIATALAMLAVGFGATAADAPGAAPEGRAAGFALQVRIPGLKPITHAPVLTRGGSANAGSGFATRPDPSIASLLNAETSVDVATTTTGARGDALARAAGVTLLDGLVTARNFTAQAAAGSAAGGEAGSGLRTSVQGLTVAGQAIEATPNRIVVIEGVGDLVVREEVNAVRGPQAARTFAIALHLRIRQDYRGLPAGTEILVGYADAGASVPDPTAALPTDESAPDAIDPSDAVDAPSLYDTTATQSTPPGGYSANPPIDADQRNQLLDGGYMFPVLGATTADFSDDWGAPRATTGHHQGIDVFAPNGTPLLAVHDGTLFRVGWNNLGGRRLWLADDFGNLFYYAHLAGFSPLAREGARVRRGDVIGFVGTSGDAKGTPPHVHFEIHPGGKWSVPPFPYVTTWLTGVRQPVSVSTVMAPDPAAPVTAKPQQKPKPPKKPQQKPPKKPKPPVEVPFETLPVPSTLTEPTTTAPATTAPGPEGETTVSSVTGTGSVFDG